MEKSAKQSNWIVPPRPAPIKCVCGAELPVEYLKPVFFGDKASPMSGTGEWITRDLCEPCQDKRESETASRIKSEQIQRLESSIGFSAIHLDMNTENFDFKEDGLKMIARMYAQGQNNIFITGPVGTGKTHFAVACLRAAIKETGSSKSFAFQVAPELFDNLRKAARNRSRVAPIIDELRDKDFLVIDDLGVERPTPFVAENTYLLIDRWHRVKKKGLIITSNRSLDEIAERIDVRVASRIGGMSEVYIFSGEDRRIQ